MFPQSFRNVSAKVSAKVSAQVSAKVSAKVSASVENIAFGRQNDVENMVFERKMMWKTLLLKEK